MSCAHNIGGDADVDGSSTRSQSDQTMDQIHGRESCFYTSWNPVKIAVEHVYYIYHRLYVVICLFVKNEDIFKVCIFFTFKVHVLFTTF